MDDHGELDFDESEDEETKRDWNSEYPAPGGNRHPGKVEDKVEMFSVLVLFIYLLLCLCEIYISVHACQLQ